MTMTEFRVTGVKAGYHTGESLSTKGGGEGERWRGGEGREGCVGGLGGVGLWSRGAIGGLRRTSVHPSVHPSARRRDGPSDLPFKRQPSPIFFPPAKEKSAGGSSDFRMSLRDGKNYRRGRGEKNEERGGACGIAAGFEGREKKVANTKGSSLLVLTKGGGGAQRATIFFSYILTCDFSVPECINSRGLFNY